MPLTKDYLTSSVTTEAEEKSPAPGRDPSLVSPASDSFGIDGHSLYENRKIPSLLTGRAGLDKKNEGSVSLLFRFMTPLIDCNFPLSPKLGCIAADTIKLLEFTSASNTPVILSQRCQFPQAGV